MIPLRLAALLLIVPALDAQDALKPRAFLPADYRSEVVVDLSALRETELLDALVRSPFGMLLDSFEEEFGFAMDDVDRIHGVLVFPDEPRQDPDQVWTFTGAGAVGLPPEVEEARVTEEVDGRTIRVEKGPFLAKETVYYSPEGGALVFGSGPLVRGVLDGTRKGGVPSPDLLSLTAAPGALAYVAFGLTDAMRAEMPPFMTDWNVEQDPVQYMLLRLRQVPTDDEPRILLEAVVRCSGGEAGPAHIEAKAKQGLEELQAHPRLGALKRYWSAAEVERRDPDVTVRLDLGDARSAAGALPLLVAPLLVVGSADDAPELEEEPPEELSPEELPEELK
jgi:hypothetical protein